jgi:hypothetical protein
MLLRHGEKNKQDEIPEGLSGQVKASCSQKGMI